MSGPRPASDPLQAPDNPFDPPTDPAFAPVDPSTVLAPTPTPPPSQAQPRAARPERSRSTRFRHVGLIGIFGLGALVAVGLGAYGRLHQPTFFALNVAGFSSGTAAKAWLATVAFLLALVQLGSALAMYGRIPRITAPRWIGGLHRWSGRLAVLASVPVAVHCLYALGFQTGSIRVLVHSLFGCFFYGAFVAKMLILNRRDAPGWALPALGGAVFTGLVALWATSAAWFFGTSGLTF